MSDLETCNFCSCAATHHCECHNPECPVFTCDEHAYLALNPARIVIHDDAIETP